MNGNQIKAASPYKIEIVPYNKHWPDLFKDEADRIQQALGVDVSETRDSDIFFGSRETSNVANWQK